MNAPSHRPYTNHAWLSMGKSNEEGSVLPFTTIQER